MIKRRVKICAGEIPSAINNLVHTKVVPHITTIAKATKCGQKFELFIIQSNISQR